jgi:hypothetical protein
MHKDKGFAPLLVIVVLVLFAMALAQCDVRYATASDRLATIQSGGTS